MALGSSSCSSLNIFGLDEDRRIGAEAYPELLANERVLTSGADKARVDRVFQRLLAVADDPGFEWEMRVVDDDSVVNAWALPGGKMAVYTGILRVAADDAELAVVIGHEMAHAQARHGTQRMTFEVLTETGLGLLFGEAQEGATQWSRLGKSIVGLKYGRDDELESDRMGLFTMARAGYDPSAAPRFWRRMAQEGGGGSLELLSTHPSDERRIAQLEALLDEARAQMPKQP